MKKKFVIWVISLLSLSIYSLFIINFMDWDHIGRHLLSVIVGGTAGCLLATAKIWIKKVKSLDE